MPSAVIVCRESDVLWSGTATGGPTGWSEVQ